MIHREYDRNHPGGETTRTGAKFEKKVDLVKVIDSSQNWKTSINDEFSDSKKPKAWDVFYNDKKIGILFKQSSIYKYLSKAYKINYQDLVSAKLIPDTALIIFNKYCMIYEIKFQSVGGSTDEKLQTCDFKKKQWQKLMSSTNLKVTYSYILNNWFTKESYKDVLDYIEQSKCKYYFNELPIRDLEKLLK